VYAEGQTTEEGMGRPKDSEVKASQAPLLEKEETPTLPILWSMEYEER